MWQRAVWAALGCIVMTWGTACSPSEEPTDTERPAATDSSKGTDAPKGTPESTITPYQPPSQAPTNTPPPAMQGVADDLNPADPVWKLLPAALDGKGLQFQTRELTGQEIEASHQALGPQAAREGGLLVRRCHTQYGVGDQGNQIAVLGIYRFADPTHADRYLELVREGNRLKDAQVHQGGSVEITMSESREFPPELGKGFDFRKTVKVPDAEIPVRSMYIVRDRRMIEVTLSNLTLEEDRLHGLVNEVFQTLPVQP